MSYSDAVLDRDDITAEQHLIATRMVAEHGAPYAASLVAGSFILSWADGTTYSIRNDGDYRLIAD